MINFKAFYFLFLFSLVAYSSQAQKNKFGQKYFYDIEWLSIGGEIYEGEISNTIEDGMHFSTCNFNIGSYKFPYFALGLTLADFASSDFAATTSEKSIMDNYEIVKTITNTTTGFTTTTREKLEEITLNRMDIGLVFTLQYLKKERRLSYMLSAIPTLFRLTNNLPKKGDVITENKRGFGYSVKGAVDYRLKKGFYYIRLSYKYTSLPDFNMSLIPGLRNVSGNGGSHAIQFGFGSRLFNPPTTKPATK